MKTASTELFTLIKHLSPNEKRLFKMWAKRAGGDKEKKYILLFDAIDAQDQYNEAAILKKFKNEKFTKQFSVAKNFLSDLIIKALADQLPLSGRNAIWEYKKQIDALVKKRLFDSATKLIEKCVDVVYDLEVFDELHYLLDVQSFIASSTATTIAERSEKLKAIQHDRTNALQILLDTQTLLSLYDSCIALSQEARTSNKHSQAVSQYAEILTHPLLQLNQEFRSLRIANIVSYAHAYFGVVQQNFEYAYNAITPLLEFYKRKEHYRVTNCVGFATAYVNSIQWAVSIGSFSQASLLIQSAYKELPLANKQTLLVVETIINAIYASEATIALREGDLNAIHRIGNKVEQELERSVERFSEHSWIPTLWRCAVATTQHAQHNESLRILQVIQQYANPKSHAEILLYARAFALLLHTNQDDESFIRAQLRSIKRQMETIQNEKTPLQHSSVFTVFSTVLSHLDSLLFASAKVRAKHTEQLLQSIQSIQQNTQPDSIEFDYMLPALAYATSLQQSTSIEESIMNILQSTRAKHS